MSMSFNTGLIIYIIVLAASIIWGVYESYVQKSDTRMKVSFLLTIALLGSRFMDMVPAVLLSELLFLVFWLFIYFPKESVRNTGSVPVH